jgi:ribulose-5-phosphate 4-epimerase/fuculose-1-phosphate aldolase
MGFDEVTASSLVKIDHVGNVLHPGSVAGTVNLAGFNIHGAVHAARKDAICVMHTHEPSTAAVASMKCGFLPGMSQHAMLIGEVPIHKYELTTGPTGPEGCQKMANDLGPTARAILLENHGVITLGETIPECMMRLFYITKACDIQVKALGSRQSLDDVNVVTDTEKLGALEYGGRLFMSGIGGHEFAHWTRIIDRVNPGNHSFKLDICFAP